MNGIGIRSRHFCFPISARRPITPGSSNLSKPTVLHRAASRFSPLSTSLLALAACSAAPPTWETQRRAILTEYAEPHRAWRDSQKGTEYLLVGPCQRPNREVPCKGENLVSVRLVQIRETPERRIVFLLERLVSRYQTLYDSLFGFPRHYFGDGGLEAIHQIEQIEIELKSLGVIITFLQDIPFVMRRSTAYPMNWSQLMPADFDLLQAQIQRLRHQSNDLRRIEEERIQRELAETFAQFKSPQNSAFLLEIAVPEPFREYVWSPAGADTALRHQGLTLAAVDLSHPGKEGR